MSADFTFDTTTRKVPPYKAPPKDTRRKRRVDPAYGREYRRKQRERWLMLGVVEPRNEAEMALLLRPRANVVQFRPQQAKSKLRYEPALRMWVA